MRAILTIALVVVLSCPVFAQNYLVNSDHAATQLVTALNVVFNNSIPASIKYDHTAYNGDCSSTVFQSAFINEMFSTSQQNCHSDGSTLVNNAPYLVGSTSDAGDTSNQDGGFYSTLVANGAIHVQAYDVISLRNPITIKGFPPTASTNMCDQSSSDCVTGDQLEFSMTTTLYNTLLPGGGTHFVSYATPAFGAVLVWLKYTTGWSWFDIKAALRQISSNWASGYDSTNYGFGYIDNYQMIPNLNPATGIHLQAPGVLFANNTITVYPFKTTRRDHEEMYFCTAVAFPVQNEYTSSTLTSLGCTLFHSFKNDTPVNGVYAFSYMPSFSSVQGQAVVFTTDGLGNYSRVENQYGALQVAFAPVPTPAASNGITVSGVSY